MPKFDFAWEEFVSKQFQGFKFYEAGRRRDLGVVGWQHSRIEIGLYA
jgi:hypothetical protein